MICMSIYPFLFFLFWCSFLRALCPIRSLLFSCYWNLHFCRIPPCCVLPFSWRLQRADSWKSVEHNFRTEHCSLLPRTTKCLTFLWEWTSWPVPFLAVPDPFKVFLCVTCCYSPLVSFLDLAFLSASLGSPWQNNAAYHFFLLTWLSLKFLLPFLPWAHYL